MLLISGREHLRADQLTARVATSLNWLLTFAPVSSMMASHRYKLTKLLLDEVFSALRGAQKNLSSVTDLASLPVALSLRARIAGRHGSGRSLAYSGVAIQRSWNSPKELRHADAKGRRMARLDHLHPRMEWESAMGPIAVGAADISSRVHRVWPSSSSMQPCSVVASLLVLLAQWSSRVYP